MPVWPAEIQQEFEWASANEHFSSISHAWRSLLQHLFPFTEFQIDHDSYYVPTTLESAGSWYRLKVDRYEKSSTSPRYYEKTVLLVQVESESKISSLYWRGQLDHEIRAGMEKMREECSHPIIHGIAVFGRRMAFYTKTGNEPILPLRPPFDRKADLAPETMWELDVTNEDGAKRLREVVEQVKAICDTPSPIESSI